MFLGTVGVDGLIDQRGDEQGISVLLKRQHLPVTRYEKPLLSETYPQPSAPGNAR